MDLVNVSILELLPPNIANDKNVRAVGEAFDKTLHDIINKIPELSIIPNLMLNKIVNETLIDLLAWQFHVDFYKPDLPLNVKIELVKNSLDWHTRKGSPSVVEELVSTVFSKALVQEWFEYDGLPYNFQIATEETMPDTETRNNLIRAINSVKNTRSFFETFKQLVYLVDRVIINEQQATELQTRTTIDNFTDSGRLRRNGRFRRDGTFVNTEIEEFFPDRNGKYKRNKSVVRGRNERRVTSSDRISPPFLRNTWERERFAITFDTGKYQEKQLAQALRNTGLLRDSGIVRDGSSDKLAAEIFNDFLFNMAIAEEMKSTEQDDVAIGIALSDTLPKLRNKTIQRDGKTYRGTNGIGETQHIELALNKTTDTVTATETMNIWIMKHHFRNAGFTRDDGKLLRDSMTLIPLE